ncbi:MAG: hypothetical protein WBW84_02695 [Acidobacteriaceae bacterium]
MTIPFATLSYTANILAFLVALPITAATWYQALRARQELRRSREIVIESANCLEFLTADGACVNLIPLETLRALPRPGDIVFLPGGGVSSDAVHSGAWRVDRVEHIYTRVHHKKARPQEARLTQAIAHVTSLHTTSSTASAQLDLVSS